LKNDEDENDGREIAKHKIAGHVCYFHVLLLHVWHFQSIRRYDTFGILSKMRGNQAIQNYVV